MIESGMMIGNRYEILNRIGSGGMSVVYKAKDQKLNRNVAVKVLKTEYSEDKKFIRKFREEAQAAACLAHPNIVNVYDVGEENGIYYIVMELVEGITLKNYIERKGKLTIREASSIAIQVSMGLEVAHNNGIVHRDIKPQNIMISKEGKVKVMDFGIAKAASSDTISSNAMGSVHYTSPEQARGGYSDAKSDIYSLGIVMYEMVTGRVPFDGETTVAVAVKHLQEEMESPKVYCPELPKSLEQIIFKCTEKNASRRYANMTELISDLKQSLLTPEGDFVKRIDVDEAAKTVMISKDDLFQIKSETGKVVVAAEQAEAVAEKFEDIKTEIQVDPQEEEEADFEIEEEEEDEEDMDPRMEKILTVGAIAAAVIIVIMIVLLTSKLLGFGTSKKPSSNKSNISQEEQVEVPDVSGMTFDEAKKELNALGIGIVQAAEGTEESDEYEDGQIVRQNPAGGTMVEKNSTVEVVICDNSGVKIAVPDVTDRTKEEAEKIMEEAGLKTEFSEMSSTEVEKDHVIKTTPEKGTEVGKGQIIVITVSTGPKSVTVPSTLGKTQEQAKSALKDAGLEVGTITEEYSNDYEKGQVMKQSVASGSEVSEGTVVNLVISKGKSLVKVPAVIGVEAEVARQRLENAGIGVEVKEDYSDQYAAGIVMNCNPAEGSEVQPGSKVTIYVSKGKKTVTYRYSEDVTAPSDAAAGTEFSVQLLDANGSVAAEGTASVGSSVKVSKSGLTGETVTIKITYQISVTAEDGSVTTKSTTTTRTATATEE